MIERKETPLPGGSSMHWEENGVLRVQGKTAQEKQPLVKRVLVGSWDATKAFVKGQSPEAHGHRILEIIDNKIVPKLSDKQKKWVEDHADGIRDAAILMGAGVTTAEIVGAVVATNWGFRKLFPYREAPREQLFRSIRTIVSDHVPEGEERHILIGTLGTLVAAGIDPTLRQVLSHPTSTSNHKTLLRHFKHDFFDAYRQNAAGEDGRRVASPHINRQFLDWLDMLQLSGAPGHEQKRIKNWIRGQRDASRYARLQAEIQASMPPAPPEHKRPKTSPLLRRQYRREEKEERRAIRHDEKRSQKAEKRKIRRKQLAVHLAAPSREELHVTPKAHNGPDWIAKRSMSLPSPEHSTKADALPWRLMLPKSSKAEVALQRAMQGFGLQHGPEVDRLAQVLDVMASYDTLPNHLDTLSSLPREEQRRRLQILRQQFSLAYADAHNVFPLPGRSREEAQQLFSTWMHSLGVDSEQPHLRRVPRHRRVVPDIERRRERHHAYVEGIDAAVKHKNFDAASAQVVRDALGRLTDPEYHMQLPHTVLRTVDAAIKLGEPEALRSAFRALFEYAVRINPRSASDDVMTQVINRYIDIGAPGMQRVLEVYGIPQGRAKSIMHRMRQSTSFKALRDQLRKYVNLEDFTQNVQPIHVAWKDTVLPLSTRDVQHIIASRKTLLQESPSRVRALLHRIAIAAQPDAQMVDWLRQFHERWRSGEVLHQELPARMRSFARQMLARSGLTFTKQQRLDILQAWEQQGFDFLPQDAVSLGRYLEQFRDVPPMVKPVRTPAPERMERSAPTSRPRTRRSENYHLQPSTGIQRMGFDESVGEPESFFADMQVKKRKVKRIPLRDRIQRGVRRIISSAQRIGKSEKPARRLRVHQPPQLSPEQLALAREQEAANQAVRIVNSSVGEALPDTMNELKKVYSRILQARAGEVGREARNVFYRSDPSGAFHNQVDGAYTVREDSLRIPTQEMVLLVERGYRLVHGISGQEALKPDQQIQVRELAARMVNQPTSFPMQSIMGHSSRWWDPKKGRAISTKP